MEPMLKSQTIRLLDVFAIGPLMVYGGMKLARNRKTAIPGMLLAFFGMGTIAYNGVNYLKYEGMVK